MFLLYVIRRLRDRVCVGKISNHVDLLEHTLQIANRWWDKFLLNHVALNRLFNDVSVLNKIN